MSVAIVDYGLGNVGSVANMLKRAGFAAMLASTPEQVLLSDRLLLPGVGAFDAGMARLREHGLIDAVREFAGTGRPLLGICLGMQLLLDGSDEGESDGLGLIAGRSVRFREEDGVRVPHMGWNTVAPMRDDPLLHGLTVDSRFYFVHSYHVVAENPDHILATTNYGSSFVSMLGAGTVMGAQFHPEKSHAFGMTVLRNFATL